MQDLVLTSRRERKKIQCKYAILRAARDCFQKNGYDETTVNQIAEAADISYASFFNYFPTKESVLLEMAKEEYEDLAEVLRLQMKPEDPVIEKVRLMMLTMIHDTFTNRRIAIRIDELRLAHADTDQALSEIYVTLAGYLQEAQRQKQINCTFSAEEHALIMLGILHTCLIYGKAPEVCQQLMEHYLQSICI